MIFHKLCFLVLRLCSMLTIVKARQWTQEGHGGVCW